MRFCHVKRRKPGKDKHESIIWNSLDYRFFIAGLSNISESADAPHLVANHERRYHMTENLEQYYLALIGRDAKLCTDVICTETCVSIKTPFDPGLHVKVNYR